MEELGAYKAIKKIKKKRGGGKKTENIHKYKLDLGGKRKGKENENMSALARGGFPGKSIPENMNLFSCVVSFFLHVLGN